MAERGWGLPISGDMYLSDFCNTCKCYIDIIKRIKFMILFKTFAFLRLEKIDERNDGEDTQKVPP